MFLQQLGLSRLEGWSGANHASAYALLTEYHDIFLPEPRQLGCTSLAKHEIKVVDDEPFRERFWRIPPPMVEEVRAHMKEMLEAGTTHPSQSPWCNAVMLVRKRDGGLHFCIDFCKLNVRTKKDWYPLPHIQEVIESLTGAWYFSCLDLKMGFWQITMDEVSKQYTAFMVGNLGCFECEHLPFWLCNSPATFQWLMQNCLGELNLMYCLIYLDDMIVFSKTKEEHVQCFYVVFECFCEHNLQLKLSKCEFFHIKINYLAHHVSKESIHPSKENLKVMVGFTPPQTYTEIWGFLALVGHYWQFIKGFAHVAQPLHEHLSKKKQARRASESHSLVMHRLPLKCLRKHALRPLCWLLQTLISHSSWKPMLVSQDWGWCYHKNSLMGGTTLLHMWTSSWPNKSVTIILPNKSF